MSDKWRDGYRCCGFSEPLDSLSSRLMPLIVLEGYESFIEAKDLCFHGHATSMTYAVWVYLSNTLSVLQGWTILHITIGMRPFNDFQQVVCLLSLPNSLPCGTEALGDTGYLRSSAGIRTEWSLTWSETIISLPMHAGDPSWLACPASNDFRWPRMTSYLIGIEFFVLAVITHWADNSVDKMSSSDWSLR